MKVSVVLGSYQGEAHLGEQLDSLVRQHRRPDELVISDDASTDSTLAIAQAFARGAPFPVRVLGSDANRGLIANFERGMRAATGDLVFLCDQDDVWYPEKIQTIVRHFEADFGLLLSVCDADVTDAQSRPVGTSLLGLRRRARLPDDEYVHGCATAFRRDLLDVALPTLAGYRFHDRSLHHVARSIGKRTIVDIPLQTYRRHDDNASDLPLTSTTPPPSERVRRLLVRPPPNELEEDVTRTTALIERIRAVGTAGTRRLTATPLDALLAPLEAKRKAMRARASLRGRPGPAKAWAATQLWFQGGYAHFQGWKSYAKDLLR